MSVFTLTLGDSPLVVSMPHSGLALSDGLAERLTLRAQALPDTDWHIPQLYNFLGPMGASVIRANYSRYVIDLNRDPSGASLYPGQATTELVPTTLFDGEAIYQDGQAPTDGEVDTRRADYYDPYHRELGDLLMQTRARHGYAVLWDAHSIASEVPRLFDGVLHDLNLGTNSGGSCDASVEAAAVAAMTEQDRFATITNGRFKGGWITRAYGQPNEKIHALQMEIAQSAYMTEGAPYAFDDRKADQLRPVLNDIISAALAAAQDLYSGAKT
jgi:N-formylglutamate deformylase